MFPTVYGNSSQELAGQLSFLQAVSSHWVPINSLQLILCWLERLTSFAEKCYKLQKEKNGQASSHFLKQVESWGLGRSGQRHRCVSDPTTWPTGGSRLPGEQPPGRKAVLAKSRLCFLGVSFPGRPGHDGLKALGVDGWSGPPPPAVTFPLSQLTHSTF